MYPVAAVVFACKITVAVGKAVMDIYVFQIIDLVAFILDRLVVFVDPVVSVKLDIPFMGAAHRRYGNYVYLAAGACFHIAFGETAKIGNVFIRTYNIKIVHTHPDKYSFGLIQLYDAESVKLRCGIAFVLECIFVDTPRRYVYSCRAVFHVEQAAVNFQTAANGVSDKKAVGKIFLKGHFSVILLCRR